MTENNIHTAPATSAVVLRRIDPNLIALRCQPEPRAQAEAEAKPQAEAEAKPRDLVSLGDFEDRGVGGRPVVRFPSGAERALASARIIPRTGMVEVVTVGDFSDGVTRTELGVFPNSRVLRVSVRTRIVRWV